jgi:hypothetical protein
LETFLAIIKKLGVPAAVALEKYGYVGQPGEQVKDISDIELERLARFYRDLPRECQLDFLALAESLWRRRRAEGRAERTERKGSGKHRTETVKPGVERPRKSRKAS